MTNDLQLFSANITLFMLIQYISREVDLTSQCIVEVEDKKTKLINNKVSA